MSSLPTRLRLSLRTRFSGLALDRELAAGGDPRDGTALARRAAVLSSRRSRLRTAAGLRGALSEPSGRPGFSAAVACDREALEIARPALEQLERAIRNRDAVRPQGLALAHLLLTDPESALYRAANPDKLYEVARAALLSLRPLEEVMAPALRPARSYFSRVG